MGEALAVGLAKEVLVKRGVTVLTAACLLKRSSEQDQLNIHYGRSILAEEVSIGLDISIMVSLPASPKPLMVPLPAAFSHLRRTVERLLEAGYSSVVAQIDPVRIWSEAK